MPEEAVKCPHVRMRLDWLSPGVRVFSTKSPGLPFDGLGTVPHKTAVSRLGDRTGGGRRGGQVLSLATADYPAWRKLAKCVFLAGWNSGWEGELGWPLSGQGRWSRPGRWDGTGHDYSHHPCTNNPDTSTDQRSGEIWSVSSSHVLVTV